MESGKLDDSIGIFLDPETEFLASKEETGNEWELFKENVRPLKRGRNVRLLNHALKSNSHSQIKNSLLHNRRCRGKNYSFFLFVVFLFPFMRINWLILNGQEVDWGHWRV